MIHKIALVAGIVLPLWNIPLIFRIAKRRSSADVSIYWVLGVWVSIVLMAPSAFVSKDIVWKTFSIVNLFMFSLVVFFVLKYRKARR